MMSRSGSSRLLIFVTLMLVCPALVRADVVRLKNGGVVRGLIVKSQPGTKSPPASIVLRTPGGSLLTIKRAEVESIQHRRLMLEEYEMLRRQAADTVDGQWKLAQWCKPRRLKKQRRTHLERIVALDPHHSEARRGLGHRQYDGRWMSRDEYMKSQGKVPYRGRYVFPQELEQILQDRDAKTAERDWHKKVKMWLGWVSDKRSERREKGKQQLSAISDPHAIPALSQRFRDHPRPGLRRFYVGILSRIGGEESLKALLYQMIFDKQPDIRHAATGAVPADREKEAVSALTRGLKSDLNLIVNRSATALGNIGNDQVVPRLIDALVTTHKYRVIVPDDGSNTVSMATDGRGTSAGSVLPPDVEMMLLTGQLPHGAVINRLEPPGANMRRKTKIIKIAKKNSAVRDALKRLTGKDFAYDSNQWRLWWSKKKNTVGKS